MDLYDSEVNLAKVVIYEDSVQDILQRYTHLLPKHDLHVIYSQRFPGDRRFEQAEAKQQQDTGFSQVYTKDATSIPESNPQKENID